MDRDEIKVHVDRRGHANLDSLPLRYGFIQQKTVLELQNCCNWEKGTQKKDGSFEKFMWMRISNQMERSQMGIFSL